MEDALWKMVQLILAEVIIVAVPLCVRAVISAINDIMRRVKNKLTPDQWAAVEKAAEFAVYAAKQTELASAVEMEGAQKKDLAMTFAQKWLSDQGIPIDAESLSNLIEGTLAKTINSEKAHGWQPIGGTVELSTSE
jgi:hypothetical protein